MKTEIKNHTGERHVNNQGCSFTITSYKNWRNLEVTFDNGYKSVGTYSYVLEGKIKNPYHPSIFGVAYYGEGKYSHKNHRKYYQSWFNMLMRGYDEKEKNRRPTYKECIVDLRWHNFQVFAKWMEENYNPKTMQGWQLDKDILLKGNKIYSPETCCFVPQEINTLFTKNDAKRGEYPIGVNFHKKSNKFRATHKSLNYSYTKGYNTPIETFEAYKISKEEYIKDVADKWRGQITEPCYLAMYNYKVEITD